MIHARLDYAQQAAEAAAFALPHPTPGEEVAATAVLLPGSAPSEQQMRHFVAGHLTPHTIPRRIACFGSIPGAALGKSRRAALTQQFRQRHAAVSASAAAKASRLSTGLEDQLREIWRGVLGIEQIALDDNFFHLGGDSLTAALMLTQAAKAAKVSQYWLPEADFFDQPTISALARMLEACTTRPRDDLQLSNRVLLLQEGQGRIPFFCFSSTEFDGHKFRHVSRQLGPQRPFLVVSPPAPVQHGRPLTLRDLAAQSAASIRALRPHGPYVLGGYCYGGVVAFETAAQLLEDGEQVDLLVLFDTPAPGYPKIARRWRRYLEVAADALPGLLRGAPTVTARQIATHLQTLGLMATRRLQAKARRATASVQSQAIPSETWASVLMREYAPRVLPAPIVHFYADGEPISTQVLSDPRLGWRDFAGAGFEMRPVPGDHISFLEETNAPALAAELERSLLAVRPTGSAPLPPADPSRLPQHLLGTPDRPAEPLAGTSGGRGFSDLDRWAATTPNAVALAGPGSTPLTYSGLWEFVQSASQAFGEAGIPQDGVVALALPSSPAFASAALAITLRWACAPLEPALTREEYRAYLSRLNASALVYEAGARSPAAEVARELGMALIPIRVAPDAPSGIFSVHGIERPAQPKATRQTGATFLLFTSATTGSPKLVPWSRSNIRAAMDQDARFLELTAADRYLSLMPLCHSSGLYTLFTHLFSGGSVFCLSSFELPAFLGALETFRPTSFSASPAVHRVLLACEWNDPEFFHRIPLRLVRSAGAALAPEALTAIESLLGAPVLVSYGLTECAGATRTTPTLRKPGAIGKSLDAEMAILDDAGNLLPPGTEGEIAVRGPMLMAGYLDDPAANQASFSNGWFRTGDVGRLDEDGYLFLVGRRKEIINRGGEKIIPQEVDQVLGTHPALQEVAAFGIPHPLLGEEIVAAAVLRSETHVSEAELRNFAAQRLAVYKVPRRIVFVGSIPKTALGKPKRNLLAAQFRDLLTPESSPSALAAEASG